MVELLQSTDFSNFLLNLHSFQRFADIFLFFTKTLLTCLPPRCWEKAIVTKMRSTINILTCSAGIVFYLWIDCLIGSEQRRKMSGRIFSFGMVGLNVSLRGDAQHCCLSYSFCHGSEHRCVYADCLLGSIYIFHISNTFKGPYMVNIA